MEQVISNKVSHENCCGCAVRAFLLPETPPLSRVHMTSRRGWLQEIGYQEHSLDYVPH